jgi:EEF1A lysine methyltransferase 4
MAPQPPPFASKEYWENRFSQNEQAFDWLMPASCMDPQIIEALSLHSTSPADILHIGCGTSLLSFHLRGHVEDPTRIHNVDFSARAIEWGVQNEKAVFRPKQKEGIQEPEDSSSESSVMGLDSMMRWSQVSLLSQFSVLSSCSRSSYAVIVDKSTVDAIACGDDLEIFWPSEQGREREDSCSQDQGKSRNKMSYFVHPVCLLALHLALIAVPGCRWIALSYSSDRFPFLDDSDPVEQSVPFELLDRGYPNPAHYWRLVRKEAIDAPEETNSGVTHRPRISYWLYVLERNQDSLQPW